MSGIEIAGLVFGIVPVVVEILKSFRSTRDRLKAFTHHAQVIYDVHLRYRVAATSFSNECQLLLKAVVEDARELSEMVEDPHHSGWQDPLLEQRFRIFLGRDDALFEEIVVRIRDVLRETQSELAQLDESSHEHQQSATQRLYNAFNISRKENRYRLWIDDLDQWNTKLRHLRSQRCKLHKRRKTLPPGCLVRKAAPRQYSDIRTASQRLHESLKESWSCSNVSHAGHQAKLSLEAKAEHGTVRLDLAIACQRKPITMSQILPSETPIWLHVRSVTQSGPGTNMPIPPPGLIGQTQSSRCLDELPECSPEQKSIEKSAKRKFKSVRFDDLLKKDGDGRSLRKKESPAADKPNGEKELSFAMCDLKATKSVCCHLQRSCGPESTCKDSCIGYLEYLEAACSFRLIFYDASKNAVAQKKQHRTPRKALPVNGLLSGLQTLHQLTLAHTLAMTILQYHSTSWLPLDWGLKDLSYFSETGQSPEDDISKTLQSLHLSTQFPTQAHASAFQSANDVNDLNYLYGIRNLTLAKLGVALIEIGRQKEIGSLGSNSTSHEVIISARKILLEGPSSLATLGPRYFKIAQKCIQCDFSCGDNLEGDDLRSAVYSEVVCGLESMIKDWKRFLDIK